jgi:eukaryotic-like serine/threonine-protein kinase
MSQPNDSSVASLLLCGAGRGFAQEPSFLEARRLKRELLQEQRSRWADGEQVAPEELLARWPTDPERDPFAVSIVYEDLVQHQRLGEELSISEYTRRFPFQKDALASLVSLDQMLETISRANPGACQSRRRRDSLLGFPDVGDVVFGFRLCGELGRGAFARVFLAEQKELAGRPVVLKLSPIEGTEPQTLAQLQHTHIVPIYSVHEDPKAGLRAVCMPYFGRASLSQVLRELWATTTLPTSGQQLVDALWKAQGPAVGASRRTGDVSPPVDRDSTPVVTEGLTPPVRQHASGIETDLKHLSKLTYVQATVWIIARLAEGLEHAHCRGVLHRDVKPSNVLISSDGQPLLLDFNLAQDQLNDAAEAAVGGTVSYMSPEHLRALMGRTPDLVHQVDRRSDIYSLGMVLFEMLTGHRPFDQSGSYSALLVQIEAMAAERSKVTPTLRQQRMDAPWSLESIFRKCLAPDPVQRYQTAQHLAEDLRCFLEDRPLKHAPELSWVERARKWTRRHPRMTYSAGVTSVAAVALLVVGAALSTVQGHLAKTRDQLHTAQAEDRQQVFESGTVRALCLVNTVVPLQDHLREGIAVCEQTLNLYGFLDGDTWREPAEWSRLATEDRRRLAEDARELLMLLASARAQAASRRAGGVSPPVTNEVEPANTGGLTSPARQDTHTAALGDALSLLDRAQAIPDITPSKALWLDRARYLSQLGDSDGAANATRQADQIKAAGARDHYLLATAYARAGGREGFSKALAELDQAIRLEPRHYWSWVQLGFCHFELGEHLLAARDFGHCTGLWPEFAWGYFNRGRVLDESGQKLEAVKDYSAALERDPNFVAAYLNRGLAELELGRHQKALADFDTALKLGKSDAPLLTSRGLALEGLGRHDEADAAFRAAFAKVAHLPAADRERILRAYGFSVSARLPEEARRAFKDVLAVESDNVQALYGLAMLAMNQAKNEVALEFFNRALESNPEFIEARRYRAVLLARTGLLDRASQDINRCLEKEPTVGATLYAAACVAARAAEQLSDPQVTQQAVELLRRAFAHGMDIDKAKNDPDLAAIRQHPQFNELFRDVPRNL